jgi:hypothetical protein
MVESIMWLIIDSTTWLPKHFGILPTKLKASLTTIYIYTHIDRIAFPNDLKNVCNYMMEHTFLLAWFFFMLSVSILIWKWWIENTIAMWSKWWENQLMSWNMPWEEPDSTYWNVLVVFRGGMGPNWVCS